MPVLTDYYRGSDEYQAMLAEQDAAVFADYVSLFGRWVPSGCRVLDVGCGVGTSTHLLRTAGFDAVGTDASARFLPDGDGFFASDFTAGTDLPDGAFGAAGILNVLEHLSRPRALLDEMVRVVEPGGYVVVCSPNLTSPLVGLRILTDLARGRTPYLGVRRPLAAVALIFRNALRSVAAARGYDAFAPRADTLATGIVGYDVDAIYWSNAAEVRRHLERLGCVISQYQGQGRTAPARLLARVLPSFAGQLVIVARVPGPSSRPDSSLPAAARVGGLTAPLVARRRSRVGSKDWEGGERAAPPAGQAGVAEGHHRE
jgi:SAM-dependent methyltransferase